METELEPIRLLVLSDLYPTRYRPNEGVFVWRMAHAVEESGLVQTRVLALRRVFPEWHLIRSLMGADLAKVQRYWRHWESCEALGQHGDSRVEFGRICYTSLPRVVGQATWGRTAFWFGRAILNKLHGKWKFDLVHAHFAIASGSVAQLLAQAGGPPFVVSVHGYEMAFTAERCPGGGAVLRRVLGAARAIIVNSRRTREKVLALGGLDPSRVRVIYQGGDIGIGLKNLGVGSENRPARFNILTVGGLERQKGQEVVLRAAAQRLARHQ